ncbi:MAG: extracellular solute-binding protein [Acidobacteria bacterium]|nr:MAG: extracellular solute-binding protein [Acidobacteriota bacterium]
MRRAFAIVLLLTACGDGRTPLVVYSPHGRDLLRLVEESYETLRPGVDVRWLDMGSQEVYDRVRSERANPQADVWFGGPATILARAAREGLLAPYRPAWGDAVPPSHRDPEGRYFGLYRTPPILVFNQAAVTPEEAPRDWDDLLLPRWRGRVLIRDPLASGTMRTIFGFILARSVAETGSTEQGFEWLRRLDAQTKEYVHNPALLHQKMVRQEGLVTMWELTDILFQRQRGNPLGYHFPASGTPVISDSVALVEGARHGAEARAFIDWLGSRETQILTAERAFRLPARQDLPPEELPEWARQALAEMVEAEVDWQLMEEKGAEWMNLWDRTIRGRGGR